MAKRVWVGAVFAALAVVVGGVAIASPASAASRSVIFVVDVSGSMSGTPLQQAKSALHQAVSALPGGTDAGLRSYAGSCGDGGDLLIPVGPVDAQQFSEAINGLQAGGGTPTPDALTAAAGDLPQSGSRTIVFISDGQSSCGDPCPVAASLATSLGVEFRVHTVGFQTSPVAGSELECIARVTGGSYIPVTDGDALGDVLSGLVGGRSYDTYVALGDSYSSGEGTGVYDQGTGEGFWRSPGCHRGSEAWPRKLQIKDTNRIKVILHAACSGAKIKDVVERSQRATESIYRSTAGICRFVRGRLCEWPIAPSKQIDQLNASTDLVTISIGGNNLGFADFIAACVKTFNGCEKFPNFAVANDLCSESYSCAAARQSSRRETESSLRARNKREVLNFLMDHVTADIRDKVIPAIRNRAPNARIIVVGYPDLFPDETETIETCGWFSADERNWTATLLNRFDEKAGEAAVAAGAEFVSVADALDGRELCTKEPWLVPVMSWGSWEDRQENAHPNAAGQQAIMTVVESKIFG